MQFPSPYAKFISLLLAVLTPMLSILMSMGNAAVNKTAAAETAIVLEKTDGFMTGVCHPEPEYKKLRKANIGWIRVDIPYPYDLNGKLSLSYRQFKKEIGAYVKRGFKVLAVTPYPDNYIAHGLDVRKEKDIKGIQRIARFFLKDLKGLVSAYQITNEMGIDRFTDPLTLEEAAKFIGVQAQAMYPVRGNVIIGYNLGGFGILKLPPLMKNYNKYMDYIGVDLYFGCFENVVKDIETFPTLLKYVHNITQKPIILAEFGYISYGEPKTAAQKQKILETRYGVSSEAEARKDINAFISKLPRNLRYEFKKLYKNKSDAEKADLLFQGEYANHIYRELSEGTGLEGYPHTPKGQAKFFADVIPKIRALDFCVGAFIYMWNDSERCYVCGQRNCPVETGWGIVDGQGKEKPAYYAVQKAFAD